MKSYPTISYRECSTMMMMTTTMTRTWVFFFFFFFAFEPTCCAECRSFSEQASQPQTASIPIHTKAGGERAVNSKSRLWWFSRCITNSFGGFSFHIVVFAAAFFCAATILLVFRIFAAAHLGQLYRSRERTWLLWNDYVSLEIADKYGKSLAGFFP